MIILPPMPIGISAAERSLRRVSLRTPRPRLVASTIRSCLVGCGLRGVLWAQPAATDLSKTRRHDRICLVRRGAVCDESAKKPAETSE